MITREIQTRGERRAARVRAAEDVALGVTLFVAIVALAAEVTLVAGMLGGLLLGAP